MKPFWKHAPEIAARLAGGRLLVTLDFDGTLAALAETPRLARLKPEFRSALKRLAACPGVEVFILSGRALPDLRGMVGLAGLYYGGNHGAELRGPGLRRRYPAAVRAASAVKALAGELALRFPPGTGVLVEDKTFSASVHYRGLKPAYRRGFFAHMRALMAAGDGRLRWSRGHKVFEARPAGAPHKGDAAALLLRRLRCAAALAVGDDLTDEDMFRAFPDGVTVRVGCRGASAAAYCLARQAEVLKLLEFVRRTREGT